MGTHRCKAYALVTKQQEDGSHITTFIGSTAAVDRADDIVDQKTWKLGEFKANPVILQGHNPGKPVVGKAVSVEVREHEGQQTLMFDVKFDDHATNPDGQRIARQIREGFLSAVSVGFRSADVVSRRSLHDDDERKGEHGVLFRENTLFELSVVAIPMNQEALAVSRGLKHAEQAADDARVKASLIRLIESGDPDVARAVEAVRLAAPAIDTDDALPWMQDVDLDQRVRDAQAKADKALTWLQDDDDTDTDGVPWLN